MSLPLYMRAGDWTTDIVADHRWRTAFGEVEDSPDLRIYCFDSDGVGIDPPSAVSSRFDQIERIDLFLDLVANANAAEASLVWGEALANGTSLFAGRRSSDNAPATIRVVNLLDGLNCMLALVCPDLPSDQQKVDSGHSVGIAHIDMVGVIQQADDVVEKMLGYGPGQLTGVATTDLLHPSDRPEAIQLWLEMLKKPGSGYQHFGRYQRLDGSWIWLEIAHQNLLESDGYILREIVEASERGHAVMAAADKDLLMRGIADAVPTGIAHFDNNLQLIFANDSWRALTGIGELDADGALLRLLVEPTKEEFLEVSMAELFASGSYDQEVTVEPAEGSSELRRWRISLRSLKNFDGLSSGLVASLDDVTESWELQNKLVLKATRDDLTGLANRPAVLEFLERASRAAESDGSTVAVIFVDLDGFKQVNDVLGHSAGDDLLVQIAESLRPSVRPLDLVARLGGDEFLIACPDIGDAATAMMVARRVHDAASGRFHIGDKMVEVGASCGLSIATGGIKTAERMVADADMAMYEQKRLGSQAPGLFQASMFKDQRLELNRDAALRSACHDGSLVVHYQPIVTLDSGKVVAYEALVRWMFEDQLVYPDAFIGLAERRGLIEDIGAWVLDEVARQAAADPRRDLVWTVNVSALQLRSEGFADLVAQTLAKHQLDPSQLVLEITEGIQLVGGESTDESLRKIAKLGIQLFVDDFGTGFASLNYIRKLPVAGLKIDRCFTADIKQPTTQTIVRTIVALAKSLSMRLVAEGVETEDQAKLLGELGVVTGQGYLFARPGPYSEIVALTDGAK